MTDQCIGDPLTPVGGWTNAHHAAVGAPELPARFLWRGEEITVGKVLDVWKETSPCKSGGPERYVRKHWFKIQTTGDNTITVYFERQARSSKEHKKRWWLYTLSK